MTRQIPISRPVLGDTEQRYVIDALREGAISGAFGQYIPLFESEFAKYCECTDGVASNSGTTALQLALAALDIGEGDEVLVSALTNMASFFAVLYCNARPIPIDIDPRTLNLDPDLLERSLTPRTRAVMVVHLYGHPCDMDPIISFARQHRLHLIEDCAEAHGATYRGRKVGGLGDAGCFSFYANKIITTGEGGMVVTSDPALAARARSLRGLAFGNVRRFVHEDIGYSYRMTNLQAAIGHAQFERIDSVIAAKRDIASQYARLLAGRDDLQLPFEMPYARNVYWMYHVMLDGRHAARRDQVLHQLRGRGIETRETFIPYNMQPLFLDRGWTQVDECPRANDAARRGFYLPSGPALTAEEIEYVARSVCEVLDLPP